MRARIPKEWEAHCFLYTLSSVVLHRRRDSEICLPALRRAHIAAGKPTQPATACCNFRCARIGRRRNVVPTLRILRLHKEDHRKEPSRHSAV